MMMEKVLSRSIRLICLGGVALSVNATYAQEMQTQQGQNQSGAAQQQAAAATQTPPAAIQRVEVTGSRIASPNAESPSPLQVLSAADIAASGATNLQQVLLENPTMGSSFDLKQDDGGMIDIEFIVQYLVLRHSHAHPGLTANKGNIALLRMCGELGLIDPALAQGAANAYRVMRRLQHQVRLQGQEQARVDPALVAPHADVVLRLWRACLG